MSTVSPAAAWLIDGARSATTPQDVLAQLCAKLVAQGMRIARVRVFVQTLHPDIMGRVISWRPDRPVEIAEAPITVLHSEDFRASPIARVGATGEALRRRLLDPDCPMDFPVLTDLRDFTPMTDELPAAAVIALLNRFFDCQVPAIAAQGGEVLKFLGDGLLAIFPVTADRPVTPTCVAALAAARMMASELAALPAPMPYGLALHVGAVSYGNIGGRDRLDFTCIGPAVNMTARLEKLSAELRQPIVASQAFMRNLPDDFVPLGDFAIKGFAARQPVFGLRVNGANSA